MLSEQEKRDLIAEARKQSKHLRKLELSGAELLDRLADALESSLPVPDGDAREQAALRRVWKAMGCAQNPDDFKYTVRDTMWDQVVADCAEHAANDTRVYRENQSLLAELLELKARAAAPEEVEWEYGTSVPEAIQEDAIREPDEQSARRHVERCGGCVLVRRSIGPWEPVGGEGE